MRYRTGDWFAIPLRFGLFAVGRAVAVDGNGTILGYFFGRFFERVPAFADVLALTPGDAEIIGVCNQHGLRSGEWPLVRGLRGGDPRPWAVPYFRTIDPSAGTIRWTTRPADDLLAECELAGEPADAGTRNWGLPMNALVPWVMPWAEVEFALFQCFRTHQNRLHRRYVADMQRDIDMQRVLAVLR